MTAPPAAAVHTGRQQWTHDWGPSVRSALAVTAALTVGMLLHLGPSSFILATGAAFVSFADRAGLFASRAVHLSTAALLIAGSATVAVAVSSVPALFAVVLAVIAFALGICSVRGVADPQMLMLALMGSIVFAHLAPLEPAWYIGVLLLGGGATAIAFAALWEALAPARGSTPLGSLRRPRAGAGSTALGRVRPVPYGLMLAVLVAGTGLTADGSGIIDAWWVPMSLIAVLRPQASITLQRVWLRLAGTAAAALPVGLLLVVSQPPELVLVLTVAVSVLGFKRSVASRYGLGSFWITLYVLTGLDIADQLRPDTGLLRVVAVLLGGLIAAAFAIVTTRVAGRPATNEGRPDGD